MATKSFFVDINRYSAQDSESDTTNIWDFKLNNTILASAGSQISIENAFINQKGITGQSIEFEEDIVETIQYYAYITEDQQSIPSALSFSDKNLGVTALLYDELLNNLGDTGRTKLFLNGDEGSIAPNTYNALNGFQLGGSGTPLILSSKPFKPLDNTNNLTPRGATTFANDKTLVVNTIGLEVGMSITTTTAGNLDIGVRIVSITDATHLEMNRFPIKASGVAGIPCVFTNNADYFVTPAPQSAFITIKKGIYGIQQLTTIINKQLNNQYQNGTTIPLSNVESQLANRLWDGTLNAGNSGFTHQVTPIEMRPTPDGIWRRNIYEEDPNTIPTHCFIPAWDYANIRDNFHPFQQPTQINYSRRADDTHTDNGPIYFLQNNNKLPTYKRQVYTLLLTKGSKNFEISVRHAISVGDRVEGKGIMKNTSISSVSGAGGKDITMNQPYLEETGAVELNIYTASTLGTDTEGMELKNIIDYQIGVRGLMVGAPEVNIQFDTDSSAFTLNNLHSSFRISSHDILGNENTSAGKVGVGLKRIAEIFDIAPFGNTQSLWGTAGQVAPHTGKVVEGKNIVFELFNNETGQNSVDNIAVGATIVGAGFPEVNGVKAIITSVQDQLDRPGEDFQYAVTVDRNSTESHNQTGTYTIVNQGTTEAVKSTIRSCLETPVSRIGGVICFNFAKSTSVKYGDKNLDTEFASHASYEDFFSSRKQAEKIWKSKTLWGKLGFSYDQLNSSDYMETIAQYNKTGGLKLRGITTNTKLDISTIPQVSTQNNPTKGTMSQYVGGVEVTTPLQYFNNFDYNTPRTQRTTRVSDDSQINNGDNIQSYAGSRYMMATMINVEANPTPITADRLPSLSKFGYYLITSDLVPTYKDVVSKGDPLGLLGVVAKTNLSNQDFIPVAGSEIIQVLNEDTPIQNIKVKVLNPDLTNPELSENSSIIIRIDVPIPPPSPPPKDGEKKHKQKKCPKTGEKICRCPPNEVGKKMESGKKKNETK